jgi:hypothetical protein
MLFDIKVYKKDELKEIAKRHKIKVSGKTKSELYFAIRLYEITKTKKVEKKVDKKKVVKKEKKEKKTINKEDVLLVKNQIMGWYGSLDNFTTKEIIYQIVLNKYTNVNYDKVCNKLYKDYETFVKKTLKTLKNS